MVALPAPMAALPASRAMVNVGPPLFWRGPRFISAEVFVVAQDRPDWVTRLLAAVEGLMRLTKRLGSLDA